VFCYVNVSSDYMYFSFCKCVQCTDISNQSEYVLKVLRTSLLLFMRVPA